MDQAGRSTINVQVGDGWLTIPEGESYNPGLPIVVHYNYHWPERVILECCGLENKFSIRFTEYGARCDRCGAPALACRSHY